MRDWGIDLDHRRWSEPAIRKSRPTHPSAVRLGPQSLLRGDAEGVDRRVQLHGGEGGDRRDVTGDPDCVVAAGELVVEELERIAPGVGWHERGLPPNGHVD